MENKQIHISQFYPCSKVTLAVELQYIVEVGKYLKDYGMVLSLDGVDFDNIIRRSKFFDYLRVGVSQGWIVDCTMDGLEITDKNPLDYTLHIKNVHIVEENVVFDSKDYNKRKSDLHYDFCEPKDIRVTFKEKTSDYWLIDLDCDHVTNNIALNSADSNMVWISLVAYVSVKRLLEGTPKLFLVELGYSLAKTHMVLSSFLLLQEETNVCKDWCYYSFTDNVDETTINHLGYTAWYEKGLEMGYLNRWYSVDDKLENMKKLNLKEGDVCFLYERKNGQKLNYLKSIEGFHFCIIDKITERDIYLRVVNNKKTYKQGELDYADFTMATKEMNCFNNPFEKANVTNRKIDLLDLGVEYCMYGEQYFITPCNNDDSREMWVGSDEWTPLKLNIPALDLVYWILKDYDIPFDEERFISRYFNYTPLYNTYHSTGGVDEKYYVRETTN